MSMASSSNTSGPAANGVHVIWSKLRVRPSFNAVNRRRICLFRVSGQLRDGDGDDGMAAS